MIRVFPTEFIHVTKAISYFKIISAIASTCIGSKYGGSLSPTGLSHGISHICFMSDSDASKS